MKAIKTLFFLVFLLSLFPMNSFAKDTDIYAASGQGVQPNILIIFDNSLSMGTLDGYIIPCNPVATKVYQYSTSKGYWLEYANSVSAALSKLGSSRCPVVETNLNNPGHHNGPTKLVRNRRTGVYECTSNTMELATGDWINGNDPVKNDARCLKIDVAKSVVTQLITDMQAQYKVRVGLMVFNSQSCEKDADGNITYDQYGRCTDNAEYEGGKILNVIDSLDNNLTALTTTLNGPPDHPELGIQSETYTPLAETLYEAGLYFKGQHLFDPNSHPDPVQFPCQKNYVIIITDGKSTKDHNAVLKTIQTKSGFDGGDYDEDHRDPGYVDTTCPSGAVNCYDNGGSDYLDDVAKYLYDKQGIVTYTIGFAIDYSLLDRAATNGHGKYFYAEDAQQLLGAFISIVDEILQRSTSFVAPIVPVSRMERTTAGDKIYLALFKPKKLKMWSGNIKMYGVAQHDDPNGNYQQGAVLDKNNAKAVDSNGLFYEASISYWNATQDGGEVENGGAGEVLLNRTKERNIYTYLPSKQKLDLTDLDNAFTTDNPNIRLVQDLGLSSTGDPTLDEAKKDALINFVHGYDAYKDETSDETKKRSWILGSFLHSRPFLVHYGPSKQNLNVIFAGSNDGMLHAFDDADGSELWGFIPPDLLPNLQYLHTDYNQAFVDGSPKVRVVQNGNEVTSAILIFGERRGGNRYYALDVTDPTRPQFLWYISPTERVYKLTTNSSDYSELGQSWSTPVIRKIACQSGITCVSGEKWVAFIGGGYDDTNQDFVSQDAAHKDHPYTHEADSKGRAVYVVDISDGSLVHSFEHAIDTNMTYSIPSDIASLDLNGDERVDRLYVGDMAGRMWRFDIDNANPDNWTGKIIFKSNADAAVTNLRKIFYAPDVTLEIGYEMLFFGTGDREHPNDKIITNSLYAVKDKNLTDNAGIAYKEGDLYIATGDVLQTGNSSDKTKALSDLLKAKGWLVNLGTGEKCLAPPVVFYRVAYFTTFSPSADDTSGGLDPCFVGEGTARVYALGYQTATAAFDLDLTNDSGNIVISKSDRSEIIGTAIPSGIIITIIQDKATAYAGMGGGVISSAERAPDSSNPKRKYIPVGKVSPVFPVNWRLVF